MQESEIYYSEAEVQELADELEQSLKDRENLQSENAQLREQRQKDAKRISELSSAVSKLKNKVQQQADQIVKLSRSDLELKEADEKLKNAEELLNEQKAEAEAMRVRASKAEQSEGRARRLLAEAQTKDDHAEEVIQARVERYKKQLDDEHAKSVRKATEEAKTVNSITTYALALYGVILTVIWAVLRLDVLRTTPDWFVNRGKDLVIISSAIKTAFLWIHDLTGQTWPEIVRYLIPFLIFAVALFGLVMAVRALVSRFKAWNDDIWDNYRQKDEKRLKKSLHAVICAVSLLLSVTLAGFFPHALNWLSWFFILSIAGNMIYHATGKKHQRSYW